MTGTSRRNKDIFEMVCGSGALKNVILVTTLWDTIGMATRSLREEESRTDFWKSMITYGSQIARLEYTYQSAWEILNQFTGDALPLLLQKGGRKEITATDNCWLRTVPVVAPARHSISRCLCRISTTISRVSQTSRDWYTTMGKDG